MDDCVIMSDDVMIKMMACSKKNNVKLQQDSYYSNVQHLQMVLVRWAGGGGGVWGGKKA